MSLGIAGMGWVTPLGSDLAGVWHRLLNRETALVQSIASPLGRAYPVFPVAAEAIAGAPVHPRLRRASAISRFAAVAGLAALEDAKLTLDAETAARTALIFAVSNGGGTYHAWRSGVAQASSPASSGSVPLPGSTPVGTTGEPAAPNAFGAALREEFALPNVAKIIAHLAAPTNFAKL